MEVSEKKRPPRGKPRGGKVFLWIYITLTVLLLGAIAFGLTKLWGFLEEYEQSQEYYVTDAVLAELKSGNYEKIFEGLDIEISPYETEEELHEQIESRLKGEFTLTKSVKYSTEETPAYMLECGGENIALLAIKRVAKTPKYGLDIFGFDKIYGITVQQNERAEVKLPSSCTFTINGKSPEGEDFTEEPIEGAERFGDFLPEKPVMRSYVIEGLMNAPDIQFFDEKGAAIPVSLENGVYSGVLPTTDAETAAQAETFVQEFSKEYSKFITNDLKFEELKPYLSKDTKFYKDLRTVNVTFYTPHTGYKFENENLLGTTQYSENCFSVSLEYDQVIDYYGRDVTYHSSYTIFAVKTKNGWQAVDLVLN